MDFSFLAYNHSKSLKSCPKYFALHQSSYISAEKKLLAITVIHLQWRPPSLIVRPAETKNLSLCMERTELSCFNILIFFLPATPFRRIHGADHKILKYVQP